MTTSTTPATDVLVLLHQYSSLRAAADESLRSSAWNIARARRCRAYQSSCVGGSFSADDVREELRARAVLGWKMRRDADVSANAGDDEKEGGGMDIITTMTTTNDEEEEEPDLIFVADDGELITDYGDAGDDYSYSGIIGGGDGNRGGDFVLHLDGMEALLQRREQRRQRLANWEGGQFRDEGLRRRRQVVNVNDSPNDSGKRANDGASKWTAENATDEEGDAMERRLRNADPLNLFGVPPPALRAAQAESRNAVAYYVEVANLAMEILQIINGNDFTAKPMK